MVEASFCGLDFISLCSYRKSTKLLGLPVATEISQYRSWSTPATCSCHYSRRCLSPLCLLLDLPVGAGLQAVLRVTWFTPGSLLNAPLKPARWEQIGRGAGACFFSIALCSCWWNVFPKPPICRPICFSSSKSFICMARWRTMGSNGLKLSKARGKTRLDVSSSFITDGNNYGSICPWEEAESFSLDSNETMQRRRALLKLEAGGAAGKGICRHVLGQRSSHSPSCLLTWYRLKT